MPVTFRETQEKRSKKRIADYDKEHELKLKEAEERHRAVLKYRDEIIYKHAGIIDSQIRNHGIDKEDPCVVHIRVPHTPDLNIPNLREAFEMYVHLELGFPSYTNKQFAVIPLSANAGGSNDGSWFITKTMPKKPWYFFLDSLNPKYHTPIHYDLYLSISLG